MTLLRLAFLLILALPAPGAWLQDLDKGRQTARAEKKDILLVFTALDFSGACVQFNQRVLSQEAFQQALVDRFVLVHLDVPVQQKVGMTSPLLGNRKIARQFGVQTFPAVFWLGSDGRAFASESGALPGGPDEVAGLVMKRWSAENKRREDLRLAYQKEGLERARAIIAVLKDAARGADPKNEERHLNELARLDPQDTLNFQRKRRAEIAFIDLEAALKDRFENGAHKEAVELVDQYLRDHEAPEPLLQKVLFRKMTSLHHLGENGLTSEVAKRVIALDANSPHGRFAAQILKRLENR
jgi:thioredoxin-related protein